MSAQESSALEYLPRHGGLRGSRRNNQDEKEKRSLKYPAKKHGRTMPRKLDNGSHTGRVHDLAASADCGDPQRSRCADPGRASRDSLPANKSDRTASAIRGRLQPHNDGGADRVSGIQERHARPPHVRKKLGSEPQAVDDIPGFPKKNSRTYVPKTNHG